MRWSLREVISVVAYCASMLSVSGAVSEAGTAEEAGMALNQILVFDAGSSGTRVHVFNVLPMLSIEHVPTIDMSVRDHQTLKMNPGLSSFSEDGDLDGAQANIEALLAFADTLVPADQRSVTPALLMATAGLRSVPAGKSGPVIERVRQVLRQSSYLFDDDNWARIISGAEEGGLGWVAANYLQGTFGEGVVQFFGKQTPSLGVIELGGGSAQVTFEVGPEVATSASDSFLFTTALGRQHRLYAHSYLGYGQDYAQTHLREHMANEEGRVSDPCYPIGYMRSGPVAGAGDAADCQAQIDKHIFTESDAPGRYASEPELHGHFAAIENFYYIRRDLSLPLIAGSMSKDADGTCSAVLTPEEEGEQRSDPSSPKRCFSLSYQVALLKALGVSPPAVTVDIIRQIKGGDIDWTLGAAVFHAVWTHRSKSNSGVAPEDGPDVLVSDTWTMNRQISEFACLAVWCVLLVRFVTRGDALRKEV